MGREKEEEGLATRRPTCRGLPVAAASGHCGTGASWVGPGRTTAQPGRAGGASFSRARAASASASACNHIRPDRRPSELLLRVCRGYTLVVYILTMLRLCQCQCCQCL